MPFVASPVLKTVQVVRSRNSGSRGAMHARRGIAARYIKANSSEKFHVPFPAASATMKTVFWSFPMRLHIKLNLIPHPWSQVTMRSNPDEAKINTRLESRPIAAQDLSKTACCAPISSSQKIET
jgi:hypothetical protein